MGSHSTICGTASMSRSAMASAAMKTQMWRYIAVSGMPVMPVTTNSTVNPKNIIVARGSQVTFINNDNQAHNMTSDPHPDHTDCPEINQVGFLSGGQSRQTGNMVTNRTVCGFHDHDLPDVAGLQGSITIQ